MQQLTLEDARKATGRGGWRRGAGRPRGRKKASHARREQFTVREPNHVTLRVAAGLKSMRRHQVLKVVKRAIRASERVAAEEAFRVCEFNLLANHLHFLVEAAGAGALARGMQGLEVRLARRINRVLGRKGKLFPERYHARPLRSPREVRYALRYVLLNARHHAFETGRRLGKYWIDPFSSAAWFNGWQRPVRPDEPWMKELLDEPPPTARARSWLLSTGWRLAGLLAFDDIPGHRSSA